MGHRLTKHHLRPRSRGGGGGKNIVKIDARIHAILHEIFENRLPEEYLPFASAQPREVALRAIRAIIRQFGIGLVTDGLQKRVKVPISM